MNRRNNNKNTKPRGQLKRTRNLLAQNGAQASRRDAVPQLRKFFIFDNLFIDNASTDFSFGYRSIDIRGNSDPFQGIIATYNNLYEQYRVRRIICRAQVGKGYTNDLRLKSYMLSRVDVDDSPSISSLDNIRYLLSCENTTSKTFTERGNIKLADWKPIQRSAISNLSEPFLPSINQWYATRDAPLHTWKGVNVALVTPETGILPGTTNVTLSFEIDVEFRGRITAATTFSLYRQNGRIENNKLGISTQFDVNSVEKSELDMNLITESSPHEVIVIKDEADDYSDDRDRESEV